VVVLPRISNFTDLDALCLEPGLDVVFADSPRALSGADVVVLPGTRSTVADLGWLQERGLADAVVAHARRGGAVLGICGGFQMLGRTVADPHGIEGRSGTEVDGLGLLDVCTAFAAEKVLRLPTGTALGVDASGYEIHHGRVTLGADEPFLGGARNGSVFGTMWHGSLEGDPLRRAWLREVGAVPDESVSFPRARDARIEALADAVEEHLDVDAVLDLVTSGVPSYPVVRGGLA
jgi:adenosylcobyric acid synthase